MTDTTPTPAAPPAPAQDAAPSPDTGQPTAPPPEQGATSAPTPPAPAPKRYKVKANGKDVDLDATHVDALAQALGIEPNEILKGAGMSRSAYERWQEAAKLRKEAEERVRAAEERAKAYEARYESPDVKAIMDRDPAISREDAWALAQTARLYERSQMSPEARRALEERQAREKAEAELRTFKEQRERQEVDAATQAEIQRIDRELPTVMQEIGLPTHPAWARAVLDKAALQARQGVPIDFREAAFLVREEVAAQDRERIKAMNDDQLEAWIGKEAVDRILKRSVARVRGGTQPPAAAPTGLPEPAQKPSRFVTDVDAWRKRNW